MSIFPSLTNVYICLSLRYPLGFLCEDPNWVKTLIVDVNLTTCDVWGPKSDGGLNCQGDLIMAFGTNTEYVALAVAYDGGMDIYADQIDAGDSSDSRKSGGFIAPKDGLPLFTAATTLEQQYYETANKTWRSTLIPDEDRTKWQNLTQEGKQNKWGPLTANVSPLRLRIFGDRAHDITQLTVDKNGYNATVTLTSTWGIRDDTYCMLSIKHD